MTLEAIIARALDTDWTPFWRTDPEDGTWHTFDREAFAAALVRAIAEDPETVYALEEAIHDVERPTKIRVMCERCRPKADALLAALVGRGS